MTNLETAHASIHAEYVDYKQGDTALRGYLAYDDSSKAKRPGVLIVHDWSGEGPYVEGRARQLAELGYAAFACDIYGVENKPKNPQENGQAAGKIYGDRSLARARVNAGFDRLKACSLVDPKKTAAIGYCFGGMVVLELARSGADVGGVVVFHGSLDTPTPGDAKNIKGKVLALQGGDDPHIDMKATQAFIDEMRAGHVDWQLVEYGGAVHAYSNPGAGNDPSRGAAYNASADHRSWQAMKDFFAELFNSP